MVDPEIVGGGCGADRAAMGWGVGRGYPFWTSKWPVSVHCGC